MARAKWLLGSIALFLVSCFVCWTELAYLLFGQKAQAAIMEIWDTERKQFFGLTSSTSREVSYAFAEGDGTQRKGKMVVSTSWQPPEDGTVAVQYTAGAEGRSRLSGHVIWIGLGFFVVSLGVVGWFGYSLWREASEATRDR